MGSIKAKNLSLISKLSSSSSPSFIELWSFIQALTCKRKCVKISKSESKGERILEFYISIICHASNGSFNTSEK